MTLFEVLGIAPDATATQIKAAHRQAVKSHHPDVGGDPTRFEQVQRAYAALSDPERRARYDATGLDEGQPSINPDQLAHSAIASMIMQFIAGVEDLNTTDIVGRIRATLNQQKALHRDACQRIDHRLGRVAVVRHRLIRKSDDDGLLAGLLDEQDRELNGAKVREIDQIEIVDRALQMLQHYTYRLDPTQADEAKIWRALTR